MCPFQHIKYLTYFPKSFEWLFNTSFLWKSSTTVFKIFNETLSSCHNALVVKLLIRIYSLVYWSKYEKIRYNELVICNSITLMDNIHKIIQTLYVGIGFPLWSLITNNNLYTVCHIEEISVHVLTTCDGILIYIVHFGTAFRLYSVYVTYVCTSRMVMESVCDISVI